jgi:hypothetical protein
MTLYIGEDRRMAERPSGGKPPKRPAGSSDPTLPGFAMSEHRERTDSAPRAAARRSGPRWLLAAVAAAVIVVVASLAALDPSPEVILAVIPILAAAGLFIARSFNT